MLDGLSRGEFSMKKLIGFILVAVLIWGMLPTRHKMEMRSCDINYYYTSPDGCGPWEVSYFWDYGWIVQLIRGW